MYPTFVQAVTDAITNAQVTKMDQAAVLLAIRIAEAMDQADDRERALRDLGPKLLAVLTALKLTPASRPVNAQQGAVSGALAQLRAEASGGHE